VDLPLRGGEPTTGESYCLYLPGMDDGCLQIFLGELSKAYLENHLLVVLDGAPSHRSEKIVHPENVSLLMLPVYSPELDPAERWFQEFRRKFSNRTFESVRSNARGAHPDAFALLERSRAPQTAHRIPLVAGGGGGIATSIAQNSITTVPCGPCVLVWLFLP
jgi:hypothetical protein